MRANDRMTAEWASEALGKTEQQEANEGMSVGQHEMRDGRTLQQQRVERQLVLPSQIRGLNNLELYLSAGRGLPVVRQKIDYCAFDSTASPFIEHTRTDDEVLRAFINDPENPAPGFGQFAEANDLNSANEGKPGVSPEASDIYDVAARHYQEMWKRRRDEYREQAAAE